MWCASTNSACNKTPPPAPSESPPIPHHRIERRKKSNGFLRLPALQRSTVILKDVLGHSLVEISAIVEASEASVKSALQRGRARLRELGAEPPDIDLPMLSEAMRARLSAYVQGFKTGDFDAVRAMLADDVKLDLVATKFQKRGKGAVGDYYGAYEAAGEKWAYAAGVVEGHAAMLVYERAVSLDAPAYFVVLGFEGGQVSLIHRSETHV